MSNNEILVRKDTFAKDAETLRAESDEAIAQRIPEVSGSGLMVNKLNDMVLIMKELHTKALELIIASAGMLEKMGYEFKELDDLTAKICKNIK